jgi:hypothetical protein
VRPSCTELPLASHHRRGESAPSVGAMCPPALVPTAESQTTQVSRWLAEHGQAWPRHPAQQNCGECQGVSAGYRLPLGLGGVCLDMATFHEGKDSFMGKQHSAEQDRDRLGASPRLPSSIPKPPGSELHVAGLRAPWLPPKGPASHTISPSCKLAGAKWPLFWDQGLLWLDRALEIGYQLHLQQARAPGEGRLLKPQLPSWPSKSPWWRQAAQASSFPADHPRASLHPPVQPRDEHISQRPTPYPRRGSQGSPMAPLTLHRRTKRMPGDMKSNLPHSEILGARHMGLCPAATAPA